MAQSVRVVAGVLALASALGLPSCDQSLEAQRALVDRLTAAFTQYLQREAERIEETCSALAVPDPLRVEEGRLKFDETAENYLRELNAQRFELLLYGIGTDVGQDCIGVSRALRDGRAADGGAVATCGASLDVAMSKSAQEAGHLAAIVRRGRIEGKAIAADPLAFVRTFDWSPYIVRFAVRQTQRADDGVKKLVQGIPMSGLLEAVLAPIVGAASGATLDGLLIQLERKSLVDPADTARSACRYHYDHPTLSPTSDAVLRRLILRFASELPNQASAESPYPMADYYAEVCAAVGQERCLDVEREAGLALLSDYNAKHDKLWLEPLLPVAEIDVLRADAESSREHMDRVLRLAAEACSDCDPHRFSEAVEGLLPSPPPTNGGQPDVDLGSVEDRIDGLVRLTAKKSDIDALTARLGSFENITTRALLTLPDLVKCREKFSNYLRERSAFAESLLGVKVDCAAFDANAEVDVPGLPGATVGVASVCSLGSAMAVNLSGEVLFEPCLTNVDAKDAQRSIEELAGRFDKGFGASTSRFVISHVTIAGYADRDPIQNNTCVDRGGRAHYYPDGNLTLSRLRAESVRSALSDALEHSVQMEAYGLGSTEKFCAVSQGMAEAEQDVCEAKNRRVEVSVVLTPASSAFQCD